jgi:hypothetical protein
VVGVDGSVSSRAALGWAVRQARLTGAAVEVAAWEYLVTYGYHAPVLPATDFGEAAVRVLRESVAEVAAQGEVVTVSSEEAGATGPGAPVTIISRVVRGGAARTLLDASAGADLLVVAAAAMAGSLGYCSARSASIASCTLAARSS